MKRLLAILFFLPVLAGSAAAQDIDNGIEAYERGDYTAALAEWLPLAEKENAKAQFYVRLIYEDDTNSLYNEVVGLKWLRSAAKLGLGDAQFVLARRYVFGAGVPKDNVLAYMWYNLSSGSKMWLSGVPVGFKLDAEDAVKARNSVTLDMSPTEIREARRRTREWLDAHPQ